MAMASAKLGSPSGVGGQSVALAIPTNQDDGKRWSFVCGQTAIIPDTIDEDAREEFESTESRELENLELLSDEGLIEDMAIAGLDVNEKLPLTSRATRSLLLLSDHLTDSICTQRFAISDLSKIQKRHPELLTTCKNWIRNVSVAELVGLKSLIPLIYHFFDSGQSLTWIEVMATARQFHSLLEVIKLLPAWVDRASVVPHSSDLSEKLQAIRSWAIDLEFFLYNYVQCLKTFPNEVYFASPNFLPKNSRLRQQLKMLALSRAGPLSTNPFERDHWEPFQLLQLPNSVQRDSAFVSTDLTRFTFSPKGTVVAFRGAHQVIIFSAFSGNVVCSFQFGRREPTFVAFSPGTTMLGITFSNNDSRLLDLKTGKIIQEMRNSAINLARGLKRNNSISVGKNGKKLHTRHKSLDLSSEQESLNFSAIYLEERTSAVGPEGLHALLTCDGILSVSDEGGNTLFFRRIRLEETVRKSSSLQRSLTVLKRNLTSRSQVLRSLSERLPNSDAKTKRSKHRARFSWDGKLSEAPPVGYKCYDIGTREAEDLVVMKIVDKWRVENKLGTVIAENVVNITFNVSGTVAILHTKNAFGTGCDFLHIANYAAKENIRLHLVHPNSPQSIAAHSVSADGDLIALCPPNMSAVSIVDISQGQEVYRIDPANVHMSQIVGLSFPPEDSQRIMTFHASGHATFWDLKALKQSNAPLIHCLPSFSDDGHLIDSSGNTIILKSKPDLGYSGQRFEINPKYQLEMSSIKVRDWYDCPSAMTPDGTFALFGKTLYTWQSAKPKTKKLQEIRDVYEIQHTAVSSRRDVAVVPFNIKVAPFLSLYSGQSVRYDWQIPRSSNVCCLALDDAGDTLAVALYLDGDSSGHLDRYAVYILKRDEEGKRLEQVEKSTEWRNVKPITMAFSECGRQLIVLGENIGNIESSPRSNYSVMCFNESLISPAKDAEAPNILSFRTSPAVRPIMTHEGKIIYLGVGEMEGWVMNVNTQRLRDHTALDTKVVYLPYSWRAIGALQFLVGSKDKVASLACINKVFGVVLVKAEI